MAVERDGTRTGLTAVAIGERDRPGARPFYRHDEEGTLKWPQPPNPHTRGQLGSLAEATIRGLRRHTMVYAREEQRLEGKTNR
uniref:Uncharacterized protein n=1 Tax=Oryza sativa subsp. japonica TaxID=39947 RepID=Q8H5E9_ORYSJ|nr:hypothetical protein [Oryza sativa Japonica Group]BAD30594.1 hypothetical protein [Oryza sativa Japonica Group]